MLRKKISCFLRNIFCFIFIVMILLMYLGIQYHKEILLSEIPSSATRFILFEQSETQYLDLQILQGLIKRHNELEIIHNIREFGDDLNNTYIIVILVNEYSDNLKYLIASLSDVRGIQEALLIFSHSIYDENINRLIEKIDFCRFLQIFYPFSSQLSPDHFASYQKSVYSIYCLGTCVDSFLENAEKKNHWWWTANMVFESLTAVSGRDAELVFFMEDDQYLLQDFLYMAIYMRKVATSLPQCNMLSMATVSDGTFMGNDSYRTEFTTWQPKYFSDVLGFDFATWNTIVSHFDMFCLIDDSWSRSVQYISLNRVDGERFKVISSEMPRSFKTSCEIGRGVTNCGVFEGIYKALNIIKRQRDDFFPPYLEVYANIELVDNDFIGFDIMKNNRVRIDIRNQELCNNITRAKVKKILLDMKTQFSSLTM